MVRRKLVTVSSTAHSIARQYGSNCLDCFHRPRPRHQCFLHRPRRDKSCGKKTRDRLQMDRKGKCAHRDIIACASKTKSKCSLVVHKTDQVMVSLDQSKNLIQREGIMSILPYPAFGGLLGQVPTQAERLRRAPYNKRQAKLVWLSLHHWSSSSTMHLKTD
jgi:hypothetical protein